MNLTNPTPIPESVAASIDVGDTGSLRKFLIAGMKDVMKGSITTWQAKAACNFAQQIYNVTALEVKVMLAQAKLNGQQIKTVSFVGSDSGANAATTQANTPLDLVEPSSGKLPRPSEGSGALPRNGTVRRHSARAERKPILDGV